MKQVTVVNQAIEIMGNEKDSYFRDAQDHINGFGKLREIVAALDDEATIFDVGANIGLTSILFSIMKPRAKIHAFEPSPANFTFLESNISQLKAKNVTVHNVAISNALGSLLFDESAADHGGSGSWSHVVKTEQIASTQHFRNVEAVPLDRFSYLCPDFIKIDVEGHEPEVIAGASIILATSRPSILMEFNPWPLNAFGGHSPSAFADALFRCFDIMDNKFRSGSDLLFSTLSCGSMADIHLRPKSPYPTPSIDDLSLPPTAVKRLRSVYEQ